MYITTVFLKNLSNQCSALWFAGVLECPPWCSIVGATVTVHQFFCILHFCHTCSLCHVELVVQFPARGSTQVLLCLFPGVLWLWHFLYSVGPHPVSSLHIYTLSLCSRNSWQVRLAKQETLTPLGHLVSPLVCRGSWKSSVVLYCWCHSDSASVLCIKHFCHTCSLCRVELVVQFPARGLTQVLLCLFPGVLLLWHVLYSVGPHPVSSLHIYTLSLCSRNSWQVRLAKQETLTPLGHLVSPLVCKGPWMSTLVLYCWCHSDSASVVLYFTSLCYQYSKNFSGPANISLAWVIRPLGFWVSKGQ